MEVQSACQLVNTLIYKPDWVLRAEDNTDRFEGTICLRVEYPARSLNRDQAPEHYPESIIARANFRILVLDCNEPHELYRRVISHILEIEEHEAREALRVLPTYWAPFHPHRADGMRRWGTPEHDMGFGVI